MKPLAFTFFALFFSCQLLQAQSTEKKARFLDGSKLVNLQIGPIDPVLLKQDSLKHAQAIIPSNPIPIPNAFQKKLQNPKNDDSVILLQKLNPEVSVIMPGTEKLNQQITPLIQNPIPKLLGK